LAADMGGQRADKGKGKGKGWGEGKGRGKGFLAADRGGRKADKGKGKDKGKVKGEGQKLGERQERRAKAGARGLGLFAYLFQLSSWARNFSICRVSILLVFSSCRATARSLSQFSSKT